MPARKHTTKRTTPGAKKTAAGAKKAGGKEAALSGGKLEAIVARALEDRAYWDALSSGSRTTRRNALQEELGRVPTEADMKVLGDAVEIMQRMQNQFDGFPIAS